MLSTSKKVLILFIITLFMSCSIPKNQKDVENLIKVLEENYPDEVDISIIFNNLNYDVINNYDSVDFRRFISQKLMSFNDGHLNVLSKEEVEIYLNLYTNISTKYPKYKTWVSTLKDAVPDYTYNNDGLNYTSLSNHSKISKTTFKLFDSTGYITIPSFDHSLIDTDSKRFSNFYKENSHIETLIIDIRNNGGGSDSYWRDLIVSLLTKTKYEVDELQLYKDGSLTNKFYNVKKLPYTKDYSGVITISDEDRDKYKYYQKSSLIIEPSNKLLPSLHHIFLITNQNNFSSSEKFAYFSKYSGFATIIGLQTNGGGIGSDPMLVKLPNSGIVVRITAEKGLNLDGTSNNISGTKPDLEINNINDLSDIEIIDIVSKNIL